jgi:hypothetical protein
MKFIPMPKADEPQPKKNELVTEVERLTEINFEDLLLPCDFYSVSKVSLLFCTEFSVKKCFLESYR